MVIRFNPKNDAFRFEIRSQIITFKRVNRAPKGYHCDHHYPPFFALRDDFLALNDLDIKRVEIEAVRHQIYRYRLSDRALAKSWEKYHKDNARLRIIPAAANRVKGNTEDLQLWYKLNRYKT